MRHIPMDGRFKGWVLLILSACLLGGCATPQTASKPAAASASGSGQPAPAPVMEDLPERIERADPHRIPTGSLWSARNDSIFRDNKAHKVGDLVTIMVSEESQASKKAVTDTSREKEFTGSANFLGLGTPGKTFVDQLNKTKYEFKFDNTFTGKASTQKSDSMTAYMTATVTEVLPNGNLVIRGSRWTKVNGELQQIILEGVIRPIDITRDNTVLSQNIAEAKIFFVGKGPVTNYQRPSLLGQLLDFLIPF